MSNSEKPQAGAGSARPSTATVRFVEQWLWDSSFRETAGSAWTGDYVRDAARMIEDAMLVLSPNAAPSATPKPEGQHGK